MRRLRQTLRDSAEKPVYIETIPRHGYRFIAPVAVSSLPSAPVQAASDEPPIPLQTGAQAPPKPIDLRRKALLAAISTIAIVLLWFIRPLQPLPQVVRIVPLTDSGAITSNQTLVTDGPRLFFHEQVGGRRTLSFVRADQPGEPLRARARRWTTARSGISPSTVFAPTKSASPSPRSA